MFLRRSERSYIFSVLKRYMVNDVLIKCLFCSFVYYMNINKSHRDYMTLTYFCMALSDNTLQVHCVVKSGTRGHILSIIMNMQYFEY